MDGMAKIFVLIVIILNNCFQTIRSDCESGNCDENDSDSEILSIKELCALVPDRGTGNRDIIRIFYNPVLQHCLPFSWSGFGGNANRFVSIKNCYEICHPSDPVRVREQTESGLHPYHLKRKPPKYYGEGREGIPQLGIPLIIHNRQKGQTNDETNQNDVVVRQIRHPLDPSKTLTIVQPVSYVDHPNQVPKAIIEKRVLSSNNASRLYVTNKITEIPEQTELEAEPPIQPQL